ncbi:hypothetical protein HYV81_04025 [Candidatus Woesearchaeota archaeon]|nr:hypothetical protein [Candidatus Woesearchaeota archaeon]
MKVSEVFVAGGLPTITYNPRDNLNLEHQLKDYISTGYKLLSLTGPTKSGKTVLCQKGIPESQRIWVTGGAIKREDDFWDTVAYELGNVYDEIHTSTITGSSTSGNMSADGTINFGVIQVGIKKGDEQSKSKEKSTTVMQSRQKRSIVIDQLLKSNTVLVIDDFHYIDKDLQTRLIRTLKDPIFKGLRVIVIAVPHRSYDAVRAEVEMTGRVQQLKIQLWNPLELKQIGKQGFTSLNLDFSDELLEKLSVESYGSPYLMQEFCQRLCKRKGILETQTNKVAVTIDEYSPFYKELVNEIASKVAFERLARGPTQRTDRIKRTLKTGKEVDIYTAILHAIAYTGPLPEITYEQLRSALKAVMQSEPPQAHEVTQVITRMVDIAKEIEGEPVLDWDKDTRILYVSDPFFSFYLKWAVKEN